MLKRLGRVRSKRWRAIHRNNGRQAWFNNPLDNIMRFYLDLCTSQHMLFNLKILDIFEPLERV